MTQENPEMNESLIIEAVDVAGIDVLEEDIAAQGGQGGGCSGCSCSC